MKIAVNTRFLLDKQLEGIGTYTYEILNRMVKSHPEHEFIFLFDRPFNEKYIFGENVKGISVWPPARHPLLWYWWFERSIPKILKKENVDVFVSFDGYLSLKSKTPTLLVIHDLAFEHYPNDVGKLVRKYYRKFTPKYAKRAKRIVTVSDYSKKDIVETYRIKKEKISVVPNGVKTVFKPTTEQQQINTKAKYTQDCDYFVYVGSIHPRKNILNLLKAFEVFKSNNQSEIKLVLVGKKGWANKTMEQYYESMSFKNEVLFLGNLSNEELQSVLGSALALTYISYFEGFGIPIIEAQQCDTPVITSNVTSMPEVAGDSCLLVDPFRIESIQKAMETMAFNEQKRKHFIELGQKNRLRYNWDESAKDFWLDILRTS